jgi:transglutaminase-like putative cysteine protease
MIYRITHHTTYVYSEPVSLCHNLGHLTPRNGSRQSCLHSRLLVSPVPAVTSESVDYFGNRMTFFTIQEPHRELTVSAHQVTEVWPFDAPAPSATPPWEVVRDLLRGDTSAAGLDAYQFTFDSSYIKGAPDLTAYATASFAPDRPVLEAVLDLTHRIHKDFRYDPAATTVTTPLHRILSTRRGVCQDFAHLEIGCLRSLGLAARYVSGYLLTMPPPGQARLVGADASHAWASFYCPGAGWIDVDPTNDLIPSDKHIVLAWGRDYGDVSPIKGVILGGGQHSVKVSVDVVPAEEPVD